MANSVTSFILGVLTVVVIAAGVYIYLDFTKSEKTVANYSVGQDKKDTYIYDKGDTVMKDAIDDSIDKNLKDNVVSTQKATISGTLCYPSDFLPKGEVVVKNTSTSETTKVDVDGSTSSYQLQVEPGTYNIRYQAHASGNQPDLYNSGYYTKCSLDSSADVCDAADGHTLIPLTISVGQNADNVKLCDFYYTTEPAF